MGISGELIRTRLDATERERGLIPSLVDPQHTDARAQLFACLQSFMHAFISSVQHLCNQPVRGLPAVRTLNEFAEISFPANSSLHA